LVKSQCDIDQDTSIDCGILNLAAEFASGKQSFCIGEAVAFTMEVSENSPLQEFDFFIVNWCGKIDTIPAGGFGTHIYDKPDTCKTVNENSKDEILQFVYGYSYCDGNQNLSVYKAIVYLEISYSPQPYFTYEQENCTNRIKFTNVSCNSDAFFWDFGDGNTSNEESPSHIYANSGDYTVTLTSSNEDCGGRTRTFPVEVVEAPTAEFEYESVSGGTCINDTLRFDFTEDMWGNEQWTIEPVDTNMWCLVDTTQNFFSNDLEIQFKQAGDYTITLTSSNGVCDDADSTQVITISADPVVEIMDIDDVCEKSIELIPSLITDADLKDVNWTFENGMPDNFNGEIPPTITFTSSNQPITITVKAQSGCGTNGDTISFFLVDTSQVANLPSSTLCTDDSEFDLDNLLPGNWSMLNATNCFNDNQNTFNPQCASNGTYNFIFEDFIGDCPVNSNLAIEVIESLPITLEPNLKVCNQNIVYTIPVQASEPGIWIGEAIDSLTGQIQPNQMPDGFYEFVYEVINPSNNCKSIDTTIIEIFTIQQANIDYLESYCIVDEEVILNAEPSNGDWLNQTFNPIDYNPGDSLIAIYTYREDSNCLSTDTAIIKFIDAPKIEDVPTDFKLCCNGESFNLDEIGISPAGGVFTGDGVDANNTFNPNVLCDNNQANITYTFDGGNAKCVVDTSFTITETTPVSAGFQLPDLGNNCAPLTVALAPEITGSYDNITWDFGNDSVSNQLNPTYTYDEGIVSDTTFTITLTVMSNCNTAIDSQTVEVKSTPNIRFGPNRDDICSGTPIAFSNATTGNPNFFYWDFGNGDTSNVFQPDSVTFLTNDRDTTYVVTLISGNEQCGNDTVQKEIMVRPNPVEAFIFPEEERDCVPLEVKFEEFSQNASNHLWNFGDGDSSAVSSPTHTFDNPGIYTVILKSDNGCGFDRDTARIEVLPIPKINDIELSGNVCMQSFIEFNLLSDEDVSVINWNFGDGDSSSVTRPVKVYEEAGNYTVQFVFVSNETFCTNIFEKEIEIIEQAPEAIAETENSSGCASFSPVFNNASLYASEIYWQASNGETEVGDTFNPTFENHGMHNVTIIARNTCSSDTLTYPVEVYPLPEINNLSIKDNSYCQSDSVSFGFESDFSLALVEWDFGDGNSSNSINTNHQYTTAGVYQVSLTIIESVFNCSNTFYEEVAINSNPKIINNLNLEACSGDTIEFNLQVGNTDYYSWAFGDGNQSVEEAPRHAYNIDEDQTFYYEVELENNFGCKNDYQDSIRVFALPNANFTIEGLDNCDKNSNITFIPITQPNLSYTWSFGDGNTSRETSPSHNYNSSGEYVVELTTENQYGCKDTAVQNITVSYEPETSLFFNEDNLCSPLQLELSAGGNNFDDTQWIINGELIMADNFLSQQITDAGIYNIELISSLNDVCFDTIRQTIEVLPSPVADFYFDTLNTSLLDPIQFFNASEYATSYNWYFGDNSEPVFEENPIHSFVYRGVFPVTLMVIAENGCSSTITKNVNITGEYTLLVPNALIPADPNIEVQQFIPKGTGLIAFELRIYDKNGGLIWYTKEENITNGSPGRGWRGEDMQGRALPQGAYLWEIDAMFEDKMDWQGKIFGKSENKLKNKKRYGTVTLLR